MIVLSVLTAEITSATPSLIKKEPFASLLPDDLFGHRVKLGLKADRISTLIALT